MSMTVAQVRHYFRLPAADGETDVIYITADELEELIERVKAWSHDPCTWASDYRVAFYYGTAKLYGYPLRLRP